MNDIRVAETFCLWSDLLGYGKAFYDSNWNLSDERSQLNLKRIHLLLNKINKVSHPFEKMLSINDGFIRTIDFQNLYVYDVLLWLELAIKDFYYMNLNDVKNGFCGIRGVLTYGQRAEYNNTGMSMGELLCNSEWEICADRTILNGSVIYTPKEFQMNTAFSKASIIESSGSKHGVSGKKLFVDKLFIDKLVEFINASNFEPLALKKESGKFFEIKFSAALKANKLNITANQKSDCYDYLSIEFSQDIIEYKNEDKNIETQLYVPTKIWSSIMNPDTILELVI